jgi:hypothetical protein
LAEFAVADFTGQKAGVYYEAGFKPAFLLAAIPGPVREDFLIEIEAIAVAWGR